MKKFIKPTIYLFLAMMGTGLGIGRFIEHDWHAAPNLFFGAMFFVLFLNSVLDRQSHVE